MRIMAHAKKYFANILLLYATHIEKLIRQVADMKLNLRMICPDHGIIWRRDPGRIVQAYLEWCRQEPQRKAVVVYDTMWHSTERMAEAIHAGIMAEGVVSMPMHLRSHHRSEIMTEVFDARAVVVGSPDPEQRDVSHGRRLPVLPARAEAAQQDRRRLRVLRLERRGREADRKRAHGREDRPGRSPGCACSSCRKSRPSTPAASSAAPIGRAVRGETRAAA